MSVITVKNTEVYAAIQSTDPEALAVIRVWFEEDLPGEDSSTVVIPPEAMEQQVWFVRTSSGQLGVVHPADFAGSYEIVAGDGDPMAQFEAMLQETAKVELTVNKEGLTPQQVIDNYITEKVALMLAGFGDLSAAQDDNESMDALQEAKELFMRVFGVKEN